MEEVQLDRLLSDENISTLNKLLSVFSKAENKYGFLSLLDGAIEDEDLIGKILNNVATDNTLDLLQNWNNLVKLLNTVSNEDTVSAINELLDLYGKLKKLGIIDVIKGVLEDEDTMGKIMGGLVNDFTLNLLSRWGEIMNDLSQWDLTNFRYYTLLMNETGEAIKEEKIQIINHWWELLGLLKDPEIKVGLGVVISILKHIGKYHIKYIATNSQTTS